MSDVETVKMHRLAGGTLRYCQHASAATMTPMSFSIFVPDGPGPFPVLVWLSGLTCTEDNFTTKAGAYLPAAKAGLIIVAPDTSPSRDIFRQTCVGLASPVTRWAAMAH